MTRLLRLAAVATLVACLMNRPLVAQVSVDLESGPFRQAINAPYLDYLRHSSCPVAPLPPGSGALAIREFLGTRLGSPIGDTGAGRILSTQRVTAADGFTVDLVVVQDRLEGVQTLGYLVRPDLPTPAPRVALILHGGGMLPPQALGWLTLPGTKYEPANHTPLLGTAVGLAQSGWTVFVPWISEQYGFWPVYPWEDLQFAGGLLSRKTHTFGTWQILLKEIETGLDLLVREVPTATTRAVIGWGEGAQLAGVLGAVDDRVTAVIRFEPPLDRRRFRSTAAGVAASAPFTQWDCALGDVELATAMSPRPVLYSWGMDDPRFDAWVPAISDSVARRVRTLGGGPTVFDPGWGPDSLSSYASLRALTWLNRVAGAPPLPAEWRSRIFLPPPGHKYPEASVASVRDQRLAAVARLGTCTPIRYVPNLSDPLKFRAGQDSLRAMVMAAGRIRALPTTRPARILIRQTIADRPAYRLEWIYAQTAHTDMDVAGLLATPRNALNGALVPAVLSLDANYSAAEPFGLPPTGRTPYLNAYADRLASEGSIVFAPTIPYWFPSVADPVLRARGSGAPSVWSYMLAVYGSGLDLLLAEPTADRRDVTAYGISYAGFAALYLTAFDSRITRLVYSNPVQDVDSLFRSPAGGLLPTWFSDECAGATSVMRYLVAPRQFVWENGVLDEGNGFEVRPLETVRAVEDVYKALGVPGRFRFVRHGGGHETRPEVVIPELRRNPKLLNCLQRLPLRPSASTYDWRGRAHPP